VAILIRTGLLSEEEACVLVGPDMDAAARLVARFATGW